MLIIRLVHARKRHEGDGGGLSECACFIKQYLLVYFFNEITKHIKCQR